MSADITTGVAWEDGALVLMARVQNASGTNITQSLTTGITYSVWEEGNTNAIVTSTALTVSAVVFNTLQTPAIWTTDSTGYNFRHDPAASTLPTGNRWYRFEYSFDPTSGEDFKQVFRVWARDLHAS